MKKTSTAAAFLENMQQPQAAPVSAKQAQAKKIAPANQREGLKHIGGYLNADIVERFAILRARLGLDNSELIAKAITELYTKTQAKRAFGDE